ncbi:MAG: leucine-rich repeat protein [Ruminiclostridium sp.]|nr:leucine-rich repeat protein [Ruminiclostridium sp.]
MNNKQEMWNNAFQKIDEKYIKEAAEFAPDGRAEQAELHGTIGKSRGGNIIFALSAAAAVLACTIGVGLFLGDRGREIPVTPSASTDSHVRTDKPEETTAVTSAEITTALPEITTIYDEEIPADAVIIGEGMTVIEEEAFFGRTDLTAVVIADGVKEIGRLAFGDCINLKTIVLPESLETVGEFAFSLCQSLENIYLPTGQLKTVGEAAFTGCTGLKSALLPETLETLGNNAFSGCHSLTRFESATDKLTIGDFAFLECKSLEGMITAGTEKIGRAAFNNCESLVRVTMPLSAETIEPKTFFMCKSLTDIIFPENLRVIGDYAFYGCEKLERLVIPYDAFEMGYDAFKGCDSITFIYEDREYTYEEIKSLNMFQKRSLTLDDVRTLVNEKGKALSWRDFEPFCGRDIGSGIYIMRYDIDDIHYVTLNGVPDEDPWQIRFYYGTGEGDFVDLREDDAAEYIPESSENTLQADYITLALPLDPKFAQITTYFGYDSWRGGSHEGIDFGAEGCHGGNIYAAESGTVVEVCTEYVEGFDKGMYLRIDHGNGLETFYSHCGAIYVKEGDTVGRSDVIASIGETGWATGPHLHFETILNGEKVDPLRYISLAEKDLTLNDVKELAKTGINLDWSSFFGYKCTAIEGYETVTKVYPIDDFFSLRVSGSQREPAGYVCLTAYRNGEIYSEIDLRTAGPSLLDRFIELAKAEQSDFTLAQPVQNPVINCPFADYAGHIGIDFAARAGTEIYAAADGVVTWAEWQDGYGLMIAVAHENDIVTLYSQCSELLVSEGDAVKKGQLIAVTGSTGLVTGECLHFEMQIDGIAVNPEFYFE